jgi:hypothetical protein
VGPVTRRVGAFVSRLPHTICNTEDVKQVVRELNTVPESIAVCGNS